MGAAELAFGRWPGLLVQFGIDRQFLKEEHGPCPACGGENRFRFDNKDGRGSFICSHCGSGDGFILLRLVKGWSFKQAATEIEAIVGTVQAVAVKPVQSDAAKDETCRRIWRESQAVVIGDPVSSYLRRRTGIETVPECIRFHPNLAYRNGDERITRHPAMIARISGSDGKGIALHRTYLTTSGYKANVSTVKKTLAPLPPSIDIRLFEPESTIGIAEGIETAMCASVRFDVAVWSCVNAGHMATWSPPTGTKRVIICGDNDFSATGQAAAWTLARRLIASDIAVEVKIPDEVDTDWADFKMEDA